jgi:hypothetical protein
MIKKQELSPKIYCLGLDNNLYEEIKKLGYVPVGLGDNNFSSEWVRDNTGDNISLKNPYYGEYSFHYWIWKNELANINNNWIGFCTYRRFWAKKNNSSIDYFKDDILGNVPEEWKDYDVILGKKIDVTGIKFMKALKRGKKIFLKNPKYFIKKKRNIKFQFDFFHGEGNLDKAIDLLDNEDRSDFRDYVENNQSYNEGNMFVAKSKKIILDYYKTIFPWLKKCESLFGFDLYGYENKRIYAFLAERFLPYWFNKNSKVLEWPIIFNDLRKKNK